MSRKIGNACELREIMGTPEYLGKNFFLFSTPFWNLSTKWDLYETKF